MAASRSWCQKLKTSALFNVLRQHASKQKMTNEAKSLLTIKDGDLFVWDCYNAVLLTTNLKGLNSEGSESDRSRQPYQVLACTNAPVFEVDSIACNQSGTHIFLAGKHGVSIVLLPQRRGRLGEFEGGSQQILCRSIAVSERDFVTSDFVLLHAAWHPGSPTLTHLVLLTSDNVIRIYDVSVSGDQPETTFNLGVLSSGIVARSSPSRQAIVLGDTFVSFDIGSPIDSDCNRPSESLGTFAPRNSGPLWPIYLLLGNGEVYQLLTSMDAKLPLVKRPLVGPLRMYPAAEDNYGTEACSILCLDTRPPILVVATCEGKLHHCLLLSQPPDDRTVEDDAAFDATLSKSLYQTTPTPVPALFVYESVELELLLTTIAIETDELLSDYFSCPIRLVRDPASSERYHCSHGAGVHSVVLPWAQKIKHFCETVASDVAISPLLVGSQHSIVEHLICTKPLRSSPLSPVLGVSVVSDHLLGTKIICLTSTLECILLPLVPTYSIEPLPMVSATNADSLKSPFRQMYKEPFDAHIKKILQRNSSNPILRGSNTSEPTAAECLKLVVRATQVFREEYIQKLEQARDEITRRVSVLQTLKTQQLVDIQQMARQQQLLAAKAEQLKQKYDETSRQQEQLLARTEQVLRRLQQRAPVLSDAENCALRELRAIEALLPTYKSRVKMIGSKLRYQGDTIEAQSPSTPATPSSSRETSLAPVTRPILTSKQTQNIHTLLKKEGNDIGDLVRQVGMLQSSLGS